MVLTQYTAIEILFAARISKNVVPPLGYILFGDDEGVLRGVHRNVSTTSGSYSRIWIIEHEGVSSPRVLDDPKNKRG